MTKYQGYWILGGIFGILAHLCLMSGDSSFAVVINGGLGAFYMGLGVWCYSKSGDDI